MIGYSALCDNNGDILRVVHCIPSGIADNCQTIQQLFSNAQEADTLLEGNLQQGASAWLRLNAQGSPLMSVTVKEVEGRLLLFACKIDDPDQLPQMIEYAMAVLTSPGILEAEPHGGGYYEIQKLNSKLVNYQRTLSKTNVRLKRLLDEAREAKMTIEALERDPLTGLLTEKAFHKQAKILLEANPTLEFDLVAADLERFKIVNDTFGTEAGDRLLADLAASFSSQGTRPSLFARAHADTFFALLPRTDKLHASLTRSMDAFLDAYPLPMRLLANLGVYQIGNEALDIARICDRALMACDSIKGNYNRQLALYDESMHAKMVLEQKIVNTMEESIEREDFYVVVQPKANVTTREIIGAEVLVRWQHPDLGTLAPADFVPALEKNGFIYHMDRFVWRKACEMLRRWQLKGVDAVPLSVNVSRTDLYHEDLAQTLLGLIDEQELEPRDLHLEITESSCMDDPAQLLAAIEGLKRAGFVIEMDDFGSGYSSLNALSELPIDVIKLDMGFLRQTEQNASKRMIMQSVIDLAHELGMLVIAEGVETEDQAAFLASMGCRFAQGYLFGRPTSEASLLERMSHA